jgi:hypothetical protein
LAELSHYQDSNPEHPEYETDTVTQPRNVVILREVYKGKGILH